LIFCHIQGEAWVDQEAEDSACRSDISEELGARYQGNMSKGEFSLPLLLLSVTWIIHIAVSFSDIVFFHILKSINNCYYCNSADHGSGITSVESSMDDISSAFGVMTFEDAGSDATNANAAATSQRNKLSISRRATPKDGEQIRPFHPRAPNFLSVEPDPDAEKVDLRHQTADDRKNAEEWMVDYALRRTVKKLARAQKRKVEMLVQAFETVLPTVPGEKNSVKQDGDTKSFGQARTWQACS
jgi:hypothetical protein